MWDLEITHVSDLIDFTLNNKGYEWGGENRDKVAALMARNSYDVRYTLYAACHETIRRAIRDDVDQAIKAAEERKLLIPKSILR